MTELSKELKKIRDEIWDDGNDCSPGIRLENDPAKVAFYYGFRQGVKAERESKQDDYTFENDKKFNECGAV